VIGVSLLYRRGYFRQQLDGTPREVLDHPELMALLQPLLRADFAVCDTYTYVPDDLLTCPISAFGGLQDPLVSCPSIGGRLRKPVKGRGTIPESAELRATGRMIHQLLRRWPAVTDGCVHVEVRSTR